MHEHKTQGVEIAFSIRDFFCHVPAHHKLRHAAAAKVGELGCYVGDKYRPADNAKEVRGIVVCPVRFP